MRYRFENFGGIIASEEPPFLAFADRQFMRDLGSGETPLWETHDKSIGLLSAPTEVHFAATNACPGNCPHCYMASGDPDPGELDTAAFKRALEELASMGVFHIALGGGEALYRNDIFELAYYIRQLGMVPNLTTSGSLMTPELAHRMTIFGQLNLSLDGVGEQSGIFRGRNNFLEVDQAIELLVEAGVPTGINCVVGRRNFDELPGIFRYAEEKSINEIEFLRFKPSGRATADRYLSEKTSYRQNIELLPLLETNQFLLPS